MAPNLLQSAGAEAQKPTRYAPIYTSRFVQGLFTNRSPLSGPLDSLFSDFYHLGQTDVLIDGLNVELSVRSTLIRRPGNTKFSTATTAAAIDSFYSFQPTGGDISIVADSAVDVEIVGPTSITSIFTKDTNAGQGFFEGVDQSLYITDGVDLVKYIPGALNPQTDKYMWNFGGAPPTSPLAYTITETGDIGIPWVASTIWSTMGLVVDSNGNVQQMVSVNASGSNLTQLGSTGTGAPAFSTIPGGTVTESDGTPITWTNWGEIVAWAPGASFRNASYIPSGAASAASCIIYDPTTNACYLQINGSPGHTVTSGDKRPPFTPVVGWNYSEGGCKWYFLGASGLPGLWKPSTSYSGLGLVSKNDQNSGVTSPTSVEAAAIGTANATTVYWQVTTGNGTSGSTVYSPQWSTDAGAPTFDGDLIWNCLGSGTWSAGFLYTPWQLGAQSFSAIFDGTNFQVCISSTGVSGSSAPAWGTYYGDQCQDGANIGTSNFTGATWVCVGNSLSWAASTRWYLPKTGFYPPQGSTAYGGAQVNVSGVNQFVINSGKSGATEPTWGGLYSETTDSTVTWYAPSTYTAASFSWTTNVGYVYCFKSRRPSDYYVSNAPPLQMPGTNSPNAPLGPLGAPTGCGDGTVSTASPLALIVGANKGAQILLTGQGSTDPQFDTVSIYRAADGYGGTGPYLFLTDIPMPPMVGGKAGTWQIIDFMPDKPTSLLPGLDPLEEAPIDNANDPPPGQYGSTQFTPAASGSTVAAAGTALNGVVYHGGRLWGFIGNVVFASGGPDTDPGNGFTAWPPGNEWPFSAPVILLLPTNDGLLVFTTKDLGIVAGGPAIEDYSSDVLVPGLGISSPNCVTVMGGLPYAFTRSREIRCITPGKGFGRLTHKIGDKVFGFDPSKAYLTYHSYGDGDHALFLGDGSGNWYRCDPSPVPDGNYTGPVWSPKATISGIKSIQSVRTAPGQKTLLLGPDSAGYILGRDSTFSTFSDAGSSYPAWATVGSIVLAHAGQMAECAFLEFDFVQVGTKPSIGVLLDEISTANGATFESLDANTISDPPKLYGPTAVPDTLWMNRHYFSQTVEANSQGEPSPIWCKHLQVKIDFGSSDTVQNEVMSFTIFGSLFQEK